MSTRTATALVIAIAAGLAAGSASAQGYGYGGSNYNYNSNNYQAPTGHYIDEVYYEPKQVCEPSYKTVYTTDNYGYRTSSQVYAGEVCKTIQVKLVRKVYVPY